MKKMYRFSLLAILVITSHSSLHAQVVTDSLPKAANADLQAMYFKKAKNQKTAAWVLLGGGVALATIGFGVAVSDMHYNLFVDPNLQKVEKTKGLGLFVAGGVAVAASIPMFISSHRSKRKAKLLVQNQSTFLTPKFRLQQTTVGISIGL